MVTMITPLPKRQYLQFKYSETTLVTISISSIMTLRMTAVVCTAGMGATGEMATMYANSLVLSSPWINDHVLWSFTLGIPTVRSVWRRLLQMLESKFT